MKILRYAPLLLLAVLTVACGPTQVVPSPTPSPVRVTVGGVPPVSGEATCGAVVAPMTAMTHEIGQLAEHKQIDKAAMAAAIDHVTGAIPTAIPELGTRLTVMVGIAKQALAGATVVDYPGYRDAGLYVANYCLQYTTG